MNEQPGEDCHGTIVSEIVAGAFRHLKELATSYLLLIREVAHHEANQAIGHVLFAIAMLVMMGVGATLLGIGLSRLIQSYLKLTGGGYIVVGGSTLLAAVAVLLIWHRDIRR
ncbi:MAG: hypothetical protein HQ592_00635 [Planctomycetes bacterium]|nr:hypothetical protein [Planctomycetota bacterium]